MNVLLVYPHYPDSFWSFKHALRFISKESCCTTAWIDHCIGHAAFLLEEKAGGYECYAA